MEALNLDGSNHISHSDELIETKIVRLEHDVEELKKSNSSQHKEFYARFEQIAVDSGKADTVSQQILDKLSKLEGKVDMLGQRPGKRYDAAIVALITAIISSIVTLLFTKGAF